MTELILAVDGVGAATEKELVGTEEVHEVSGKERIKNKSSKDCTWSAVPDALLGVIAEEV